MLIWLSRIMTIVAVSLAVWAGWLLLATPTTPDAGPSMTVDCPGPNLGELEVGLHEIVVRITNRFDRPRRVVGMMRTCGPNGCAYPKLDGTTEIPPGGTHYYPCLIDIRRPASFEFAICLFLEEDGIREVRSIVYGVGIEPKGKNSAKSKSNGP